MVVDVEFTKTSLEIPRLMLRTMNSFNRNAGKKLPNKDVKMKLIVRFVHLDGRTRTFEVNDIQ